MTKPIAPDDLKKGMWVVVTARKLPEINIQGLSDTMQHPGIIPIQIEEPTGVPIKIHAVSLPFIVGFPAIAPYQLTTICLTNRILRQPTKQYVDVFVNHYLLMHNVSEQDRKSAFPLQ